MYDRGVRFKYCYRIAIVDGMARLYMSRAAPCCLGGVCREFGSGGVVPEMDAEFSGCG
jgi:hypothetical protein